MKEKNEKKNDHVFAHIVQYTMIFNSSFRSMAFIFDSIAII